MYRETEKKVQFNIHTYKSKIYFAYKNLVFFTFRREKTKQVEDVSSGEKSIRVIIKDEKRIRMCVCVCA